MRINAAKGAAYFCILLSSSACTTSEQEEFTDALLQFTSAYNQANAQQQVQKKQYEAATKNAQYDRSFDHVIASRTPDEFLSRSNTHLSTYGDRKYKSRYNDAPCVDDGRSTCGKR